MALDFKGQIFTWSIPTGKLLRVYQLPDENFEQFEVYDKQDKSGCVLIKSKEAVEVNQEDFFEPSQLTKSTSKQTPFVINLEKTIRKWRYIEIKNET